MKPVFLQENCLIFNPAFFQNSQNSFTWHIITKNILAILYRLIILPNWKNMPVFLPSILFTLSTLVFFTTTNFFFHFFSQTTRALKHYRKHRPLASDLNSSPFQDLDFCTWETISHTANQRKDTFNIKQIAWGFSVSVDIHPLRVVL